MAQRTFEDVLRIIKPAPDSQYRLRPCKCGSTEVVYASYNNPAAGELPGTAELWRVVCTDCKETVDRKSATRHGAQIEWNARNDNV